MPHVLETPVDYDKLATAILKQSNYRSSSVLPQPTTSTTLLPSEEPSNSATTVQSSHSDSTASLSQPTTSAGAKDNFPQQDPEVELAFHSQPVSSTWGLGSLIDQIFLDEPAKSRENHAMYRFIRWGDYIGCFCFTETKGKNLLKWVYWSSNCPHIQRGPSVGDHFIWGYQLKPRIKIQNPHYNWSVDRCIFGFLGHLSREISQWCPMCSKKSIWI